MFGIVLVSVTTVMHAYVFWRAAGVPFVQRHVPMAVLIAAGVLLWGIFYLGRTYGHNGTGPAAAVLEFLGMNWMAAVFLTFVLLLAVDLVTAFGLLLPRLAPTLRGGALAAGALLSAAALCQGLRPPVVQPYEVRLNGLPENMDGTVIVGLSDLHLGSLIGERWLAARVAQVNAQRPDLVVLLGDIFEGHGPPRPELIQQLERLAAPLGVWAVPGNHEHYGGHATRNGPIVEAGFQLLDNRWVEVRPGLVLAGVEDLTVRSRAGRDGGSVAAALAGRPAGATVLLSHTPAQVERIAQAGVGLMLSGHTHGGQIWPFGYLVRLFYPLLAGRYDLNPPTVIVCRGTGTWGPRMRLWRPGEILRVTLRSAAAAGSRHRQRAADGEHQPSISLHGQKDVQLRFVHNGGNVEPIGVEKLRGLCF